MAEGHAVARWAGSLRALVGERLEAVDAPERWLERAALVVGERVTEVLSHGKHLLIRCSGGWVFHCHAMQYGSWQIGEPGQELRKEKRYIRLRLLTSRHEAVYFHGPVMEILTEAELAAHEKFQALGPDILDPALDRTEILRRFRESPPERPVGDAVLDQNIVAGIGNIYKSEGLFLAGIDPRRPVSEIGAQALDRIWDGLGPLMREGTLHYGPTGTLPPSLRENGDRNWVYQRSGRPCFRCGETIQRIRQGDLKRATFFCPHCQT